MYNEISKILHLASYKLVLSASQEKIQSNWGENLDRSQAAHHFSEVDDLLNQHWEKKYAEKIFQPNHPNLFGDHVLIKFSCLTLIINLLIENSACKKSVVKSIKVLPVIRHWFASCRVLQGSETLCSQFDIWHLSVDWHVHFYIAALCNFISECVSGHLVLAEFKS